MSRRLLVAEDDPGFRETLALEFEERGFEVIAVGSFDEFAALGSHAFDFAVVDLKLGSDHGLRVVEALSQSTKACSTIVLTGYGSIATAVQATKLGAKNYLTKPASIARILAALEADEMGGDLPAIVDQPFSLARAEREYIESVIASCNGNISRAASQLGVHRQSLQRKLRKFTPSR